MQLLVLVYSANRRVSRSFLLACLLVSDAWHSEQVTLERLLPVCWYRESSEICSTVCILVKNKRNLSLISRPCLHRWVIFRFVPQISQTSQIAELGSSCLAFSGQLTDGKKPRVPPADIYTVFPRAIPGSLFCPAHTAGE